MPYVLRNIHTIESFLWAEHYTLYHSSIIIVGIHANLTTK